MFVSYFFLCGFYVRQFYFLLIYGFVLRMKPHSVSNLFYKLQSNRRGLVTDPYAL